jgi:hypothetical protein
VNLRALFKAERAIFTQPECHATALNSLRAHGVIDETFAVAQAA